MSNFNFPTKTDDLFNDEPSIFSPTVLLQNLQNHLSSISQLSCLTSLIHQAQVTPSKSSILSNYHLYYYSKAKKADLFYFNQSLLNSTNSANKKLKGTNDKNKGLINEINWTAQEKIDSINEKEQMEQDFEKHQKTERANKKKSFNSIESKKQNLKQLKELFPKLTKEINQRKKLYGEMQEKYKRYINDNKALTEKIKQKQIIYDHVIKEVNEYKILLLNHKKLVSADSRTTHDTTTNVDNTKKRNKSTGLFKKLFQ